MTAVAVLVRRYPKVSETFIVEEILGLERLGMTLSILSLYPPTDPVTHAAHAAVRAGVTYRARGWLGGLRLAVSHARLLATRPRRYVAALWFAARRAEAGRARDFLHGGWLGARMIRAGLRHVHAHFASEPAAVAEIAARLTGCTYSISAHAKDIYTGRPEVLRRKLSAARFTVTCTEYNRLHLDEATGGASRVYRCYHGVDTARFAPTRRVVPDAPPLVLGVGRFRPKKGFGVLVEACRILRDQGVPFQCEIVGYGAEGASLAARIVRGGLAGVVRLVGVLPQDAIISRYARASVFVLPCQIAPDGDRDGIPNVLLEAMAMGVPVVSTPVSGIPELIENGESGVLCPAGDAPALARAIREVLSDRTRAERLAAGGRARVAERFSSARNVATLHRLLLTAVPPAPPAEIAYVLKGFPRLSETFIAHEIHRLERAGLRLRLISIKREDEPRRHRVVDRIRAPLSYLPAVTSLSGRRLPGWLRENTGRFAGAHLRLLRRRPARYLAVLGSALAMCRRYRTSTFGLRKVFVKEFMQAGYIADQILAAGTVRHLHGHYCHGVATITWLASRLSGIPWSFTAHAKDIYQADLNPGDLLARKVAAATFVATCTAANRRHLRERCPAGAPIHTVYHGLDTEYFAPAAAGPAGRQAPLVLSVGRLVEKKGFEYLVEACARLREAGVPFRALIVGEAGDASERIAGLIRERGLAEQLRIRDAVVHDELREIFREAAVFVLPCQVAGAGDRDGIPNVLVEAMAMGVPVVSTPISGIPELVENGVNGMLVPSRDGEALAAAIEKILGNPAEGARLAEAARRTVCERFDATRTTLALRDLFLRAIG